MGHFTRLLFSVVIMLAIVIPMEVSAASTKAVVFNERGNVVISKVSGECVRTKWEVAVDKCASTQVKKPVMPTVRHAKFKKHRRSYMVFFDFNQYSLTANARDILTNLLNKTSSAQKILFDLTGHTDRSGSDDYNMRLSRKRAVAVKQYFIEHGIHPEDIEVNWQGESVPLVPTEDGIKEAQNRRTEINVMTEE